MATDRAYVGSNFAMEVDGINAGIISSVSGGLATADVISENMGVTSYVPKHLGNVTYPDISFKCGTAMSKGFYDWIKASFDMNLQRKNGAVITTDFNYKEMARMSFFNALITKIAFPALDASSKDAAQMDLSIGVEKTTYQTSPAGSISGKYPIYSDKQKRWTCANFRLKIDGLDDVCKATSKIDSISLTQSTALNAVGELRDTQKEPASLAVPDLVITAHEHKADALYAWHKSFVIDGTCDEKAEKTGTLEFLTTDLKTVMFTLTFEHLGIYKIEPDGASVSSEDLRKVKATMYCEHMKFEYNSQFVGA